MSKRNRPVTISVLILILFSAMACAAGWQSGEMNDQLAKGEIMVEITKVTGTNLRIGRAAGLINAPMDQVWSVLGDYNHYAVFMPRIRECFMIRPDVLDKISGMKNLHAAEPVLRQNTLDSAATDTVLTYNCLDLPLPLGDRRYIIKIIHDKATYATHWELVKGELKVNDGSWELYPYEGKTLAVYTSCSDPGIPVPSALLSMATKIVLPDVINAVRERVKTVQQ